MPQNKTNLTPVNKKDSRQAQCSYRSSVQSRHNSRRCRVSFLRLWTSMWPAHITSSVISLKHRTTMATATSSHKNCKLTTVSMSIDNIYPFKVYSTINRMFFDTVGYVIGRAISCTEILHQQSPKVLLKTTGGPV